MKVYAFLPGYFKVKVMDLSSPGEIPARAVTAKLSKKSCVMSGTRFNF